MDSGEYTFDVNQQESVSSQSIQLQEKNIKLPPELQIDNSLSQGSCQECVEMACIHLETHFTYDESDPSEVNELYPSEVNESDSPKVKVIHKVIIILYPILLS